MSEVVELLVIVNDTLEMMMYLMWAIVIAVIVS